jgi:hypothetical protein
VAGASFRIVDNDDAETVFRHIVEQFAATVQPLVPSSCFGFNYRPNVNNPDELSNHSSATALDINAEQHPNARPTLSTFTRAQVAACHAILVSVPELDDLVHWGGDWASPLTTDAMHWEFHSHDLALLRRVADRIREDIVTPQDKQDIIDGVVKALTEGKPKGSDLTRDQLLKQAQGASDEARDLLRAAKKDGR